jgi:MFS family permease
MESLDTTILNTAVPAVSQALGVALLSMKSVLASYTLSLAVFVPISGWMADRFGTRTVFASAIGEGAGGSTGLAGPCSRPPARPSYLFGDIDAGYTGIRRL